ncbi:hypothetical protein ACFWZT_03735 [Streptomyces alboflavus]|uniref:hypothetical protein n=1 Tax=Streptomyces alboflavus TaxID=67267 RepID=UPI0036B3F83D
MSTTLSPPGTVALWLILAGALTMMCAAVVLVGTGESVWRFVVAGGGVVQFTGWALHRRALRRARGGAG